MTRLLLLLALACALHAETRAQRIWRWSAAAVVAGASMDVASSYGRWELNPLYRDAEGRFGRRGVALRSGIVAGEILIGWSIMRKHPQTKGPAICNFAAGSGLGLIAVRNWRLIR